MTIQPTKAPQACDNCRKHKLKCSRTVPHCIPCIKNGRSCTYEYKPQKRGPKPRDPKKLDLKWHKPDLGLRVFSALSQDEVPTSPMEEVGCGSPMLLNFQLPSNVLPPSSPLYNSNTSPILPSNYEDSSTFKSCTNSSSIESEYLDLRDRLHTRLRTFISFDQIEILSYYFSIVNPIIELVELEDFVEEFCFASSMPAFFYLINTIQVITDLYLNNQQLFLASLAEFSLSSKDSNALEGDPAFIAASKLQQLANLIVSEP